MHPLNSPHSAHDATRHRGASFPSMQALVVAGFAGLQAVTRGAARERALAT
jgi:hypothetical protein